MVTVSVSATVSVAGGPQLPVDATLDPESYVVASVTLGAAGSGTESDEVPLLPDGGTMTALALRALADGAPATVVVTPSNGAADGDALTVEGVLLVAHAGVLEALVAGGPRTVTVENAEATEVTVDVIACLGA